MLAHADFEYEDVYIETHESDQLKASGANPYNGWPVWSEQGVISPQSNAILRFLGIRLGYYHTDAMKCYQIDSVCEFMDDLFPVFGAYAYPAVMHNAPVGDEDEWLENFWQKKITLIQGRLADHGKAFIAGSERPTIADFKAFVYVSIVFDRKPDNFYSPALREKVTDKISASPNYARWVNVMYQELASYLATRQCRPL